MGRSNIYISMAAVCFVLGIMLALQYKANYTNDLWPSQESQQTVQTERLRKQNDELINEIALLQDKLSQSNERVLISEVNKMLDKATICGGLSKVTGPGVTIHYYFAPASNLLYSPTLEMQAKDLLIIINELRSAGAEAISINNHRLLATSPIYYRGNSITVNNHNVSAPYEIRAIGNPDVIYSSLRLKGGEVDNLILLGYKVDIEKNKTIDIPAFTASPPPSPTTDLSRIRQKVPFAVIIPTNVPDGLAPASPLLNPGPPASVSIYYLSETGSSGLLVINSPAGSGLAADERKTGEAIVLRNNISGHFLKNHPEFGGPILWWEESGTYVAQSGPQLTKEDLAEIANSMSSDADIRQGSE